MVNAQLLLWIRLPKALACERLIFYLDSATRPDFPDEVPENEAAWVEAFELLPDPSELHRIDASTLMAYFDDESGAEPSSVCEAIALFSPVQLLSWEDVEGEVLYQSWQGDSGTLLYAPEALEDPEDEIKYNRCLNEAVRQRLVELGDNPDQALRYLAEHVLPTY